jgi:hypothetical protein
MRCLSPSCWRYRVASKSASKAARITQMLRRIVRTSGAGALGTASRSSNAQIYRAFQREICVYFLKPCECNPTRLIEGVISSSRTIPTQCNVCKEARSPLNLVFLLGYRAAQPHAAQVAFTGPGPSSPLAGIGGMSASPAGSSKRGDYP